MAWSINAGISVSVDGTNWYNITDDNRQSLDLSYVEISKSDVMAEGTTRKYVVARKHKFSTSWNLTWSSTANTSDGNKGAAWLKSFYEANIFVPIYYRTTIASINTQNISTTTGFIPAESQASQAGYTAGDTYISSFNAPNSTNTTFYGYMSGFTYKVVKRNLKYDFVDMTFEFTEK